MKLLDLLSTTINNQKIHKNHNKINKSIKVTTQKNLKSKSMKSISQTNFDILEMNNSLILNN